MTIGVARLWGETFRSLRVRNFRLFFVSQLISQSGGWMTRIAQTLLVLGETGSGVMLGVVTACQFGPMLILGAWTGTLADRVDKRRLLFAAQCGAAVQSFGLGVVVLTRSATVGTVLLFATVQGILTAFDNPVRRSFVVELVPKSHMANAVSLNTTVMTGARVLGPALAGVVIGTLGYAWCFLIDGFSYIASLGGIALMRKSELFRATRAEKARGQVRDAFRYVLMNRDLFVPIVMLAIIGTLAFNFAVSMPLLITGPLGGSEQAFTLFFSTMFGGGVVGALGTARRQQVPPSHLVIAATGFGVALSALAVTPTLWLAYPLGFLVGMGSIGFMTSANAMMQLQSIPTFRGRVTALQAMVNVGSAPLGGLIIGWLSDAFGSRTAVLIGGLGCFAAAVWGHVAFSRSGPIRVNTS